MKRHGRYIGKDISGRKIYFARQDKISKIYDEALVFIYNVFNIRGAFLSDESSLSDFLGFKNRSKEMEKIVKKIKVLYGVDTSPLKEKPLVDMVSFILKRIG